MDVDLTPRTKFIMGIIVLFIAFAISVTLGMMWHKTTVPPAQPNGGAGRDYTVPRTKTIDDFLASKNVTAANTKMRSLSVATASFGGIFTEDIGPISPYIGTVSPDAVRLQVLGGARAIVFDIWPDPADPATPVVCAMKEDGADGPSWLFGKPAWWLAHGGLDKGTGRYSNWKLLSRNKVRAGTMMTAAVTAATTSATNPQWNDPFFLILILHGAMTPAYLNTLAADLSAALNGKGIAATARPGTLNTLCNATVDQFQGRVGVIVCPDIQPGFQALPNVNTFQQFVTAYSATNMINYTNVLQTQPNTVLYTAGNVAPLKQDSAQPCDSGTPPGTLVPPPQGGFCVVQPSTGNTTTNTMKLYTDTNAFLGALQTGAQFVGANLFDSDADFLNAYFSPDNFGTYSFKLNA